MRAGIIAAGEGSRLKSEGLSVPKPLVKVDGMPLIERLIRLYSRQGISDIVCIINESSHEVKTHVENLQLPIPVRFVVKTTPSSMHSLFALAPHLRDGQFLLSTVDSIFDEKELGRYLEYGRLRGEADGVLAVTRFVDDENPLYVNMDDDHRILAFSKSDVAPWITGGLYIFSPRIFAEIDTVIRRNIERLRNFLGFLVDQQYRLEGFPFGTMIDVDHVADIGTAENLLRTR